MLKKLNMVASVLTLLILVLTGCANGMLREDEATVNGYRNSSGARNVKVIITNLRSNGMMRTIAPDPIGGQDLKEKHVLVATGYSGYKRMTPTIITVTDDKGSVDLSNLDPGVWTVTITAYNKQKLQGEDPSDPNTQDAILDGAKVLAGTAIVDLTSSDGEAIITLTPRGIEGNGNVDLDVTFNQADVTAIGNGIVGTDKYKVTIGLYDKLSGKPIVDEQKQPIAPTEIRLPITNPVEYNAGGKSIPKGVYLFKVLITHTDNNDKDVGRGPWQYTDELYIEGNITTEQEVNLPQLIGTPPTNPEKLAVFWDKDEVDSDKLTWTAKFAWERKSYNELSFELQIADITDKYTITNATSGSYNPNGGQGGTNVNSGDNLWTQIDQDTTAKVYKFDLNNFNSNTYPIYKDGTVLAGSTSVEYELPAGRIYTARIRSTNANGAPKKQGTTDDAWTVVGTTAPNPNPYQPQAGAAGGGQAPTQLTKSGFVFDVLTLTYDLQSKYLLLKNNEQNANAIKGKRVTFAEYEQGQGVEIEYLPDEGQAGQNNYLLYPESFTGQGDRGDADNLTWTGWRDEKENNPQTTYNAQQKYQKPTSVVLVPTGVSGGTNGGKLDVQNSGTYAKTLEVDGAQKILIDVVTGPNPQNPTWNGNNQKLSDKATPVNTAQATQGLGKIGDKYALNMPVPTGQQETQTLFFAIGQEVEETGGQPAFQLNKLQLSDALDGTKRVGTVVRATYSLEQNGSKYKKTVTSPYGTSEASLDVTGEQGDFTLRVEIQFDSGWSSTFQTPFIFKYVGEAVNP